MGNDARRWISALRASHDRLTGIVEALGPDQVAGPSYCDDWSVAQVLSHLGSGAEIGLANLEASLAGDPAPSRDTYQAIWDRWNAKSPAQMATDALAADQAHVRRVEGLSDDQLASLSMEFMGRSLDAVGIVGLRLGEHAVHTWDVEVAGDEKATIPESAAELLVDLMPPRVGRLARGEHPKAAPVDLAVDLTAPARSWHLRIADDVTLTEEDDGTAQGRLSVDGEALVRLVYGRLDPDHTPSGVLAEGPVTLAELRTLFPGF